jgi:hypothetical protein
MCKLAVRRARAQIGLTHRRRRPPLAAAAYFGGVHLDICSEYAAYTVPRPPTTQVSMMASGAPKGFHSSLRGAARWRKRRGRARGQTGSRSASAKRPPPHLQVASGSQCVQVAMRLAVRYSRVEHEVLVLVRVVVVAVRARRRRLGGVAREGPARREEGGRGGAGDAGSEGTRGGSGGGSGERRVADDRGRRRRGRPRGQPRALAPPRRRQLAARRPAGWPRRRASS